MKPSLELEKVVLLGRTLDEYVRYFGLNIETLAGKAVLDVASGVSSFCAEANRRGIDVTAFDPIYELQPDEIRRRCEPDLEYVTKEIGRVAAYRWGFYKDPEGMRQYRERAYRTFLPDFEQHRGTRYLSGKLPRTPFRDGQFDLTLVSYFLFVYEDQFDYEFHRQSILELARITAGELRIYPGVNFKAERCRFVDPLKKEAALQHFQFEEVPTDFEFLAGSNWFLRMKRR
jgi:hypothetical protein